MFFLIIVLALFVSLRSDIRKKITVYSSLLVLASQPLSTKFNSSALYTLLDHAEYISRRSKLVARVHVVSDYVCPTLGHTPSLLISMHPRTPQFKPHTDLQSSLERIRSTTLRVCYTYTMESLLISMLIYNGINVSA